MGCPLEAHHLNHFVWSDVSQGFNFREEAAATDVELLGQEVDRKIGIAQVLLDDLIHAHEEFVVDAIASQRFDAFLGVFGEASHQVAATFDEIADTGVEILHGEWFLDEDIGTEFHALRLRLVVGLGGEHDERDMAGVAVGAHPLAELRTIHLRHHPVADNQRYRTGAQHRESLVAIGRREHRVVAGEMAGEERQHVGIVLDDEHRRRRVVLFLHLCGRWSHGGYGRRNVAGRRRSRGIDHLLFDGQGDDEARALSHLRAHPHLAMMLVDNGFHNGEADARARFVVARLIEGIEDFLLIGLADADAVVFDDNAELFAVGRYMAEQRDTALGILGGIGHEIADDLCESFAVDHCHEIGRRIFH